MGLRRRDTRAQDYTKDWQGQGTKQLGLGRAKGQKQKTGNHTEGQAGKHVDRHTDKQTGRK